MVRKYGPSLGLLVLIAAITMWVMMKNTDMSAVLQAARSLRWYCLLAALAITLLAVALEGVIIRLLLNTRGSRTGLGVAISWAFVGFLFSGITPSATGGQPVQLYYMKQHGVNISAATPVLMITATLYKVVLVVMGLALWLFQRTALTAFFGSYLWLFYLGMGLNTGVVVILILIMRHPRLVQAIVLAVDRLLMFLHITNESRPRREKLLRGVQEYQDAVHFFAGCHRQMAAAILLTIMQRLAAFSIAAILYYGFGLNTVHAAAIIASQMAMTISVDLLPLPGAAGITELVCFTVFRQIFPGDYLTASICLLRSISFYWPLAVSLMVYIYTYITRKNADYQV